MEPRQRSRPLTEQERRRAGVDPYVERLMLAVRASGLFAGSEARHEARELVVYAVRDPAPEVERLLAEAPEVLRVTWRHAPYTAEELGAEARRVMVEQSGRLSSGGARRDGSGLEFTTTDLELLGASHPEAALGSRYPVRIEYGERPVEH